MHIAARFALPILILGACLTIPATAQSPAGADWHLCLGTAQCRENRVGTGAEARTGAMVRLRGTTWSYAPDAPDFKGPMTTRGVPADVAYELLPTPPSAYGYTITDLIVGMKVGGIRSVAIGVRRFVTEYELLDVATKRLAPTMALV